MPPTVADLYKAVLDHPTHTVPEKIKLLNEIRKINTAEGDRWVYRPVSYSLGLIPIILIVSYAAGWLKEINDGLLSLSSAAVGALASFLTTGVASKSDAIASVGTDQREMTPPSAGTTGTIPPEA
jgi:hypothetical protein